MLVTTPQLGPLTKRCFKFEGKRGKRRKLVGGAWQPLHLPFLFLLACITGLSHYVPSGKQTSIVLRHSSLLIAAPLLPSPQLYTDWILIGLHHFFMLLATTCKNSVASLLHQGLQSFGINSAVNYLWKDFRPKPLRAFCGEINALRRLMAKECRPNFNK